MKFLALFVVKQPKSVISWFTGRLSPSGEDLAQYFNINSSRLSERGRTPHSTSSAGIGVVLRALVAILRASFCIILSHANWFLWAELKACAP